MLRLLFWSCFLGHEEIVDSIIHCGYSPYIDAVNNYNGLMAAIVAERTNIVQLITSYHFNPSNP